MVSLYCQCVVYVSIGLDVRDRKGGGKREGEERGIRTISKNCPSMVYTHPLLFISSATLNTCSTARGIMPAVDSVCCVASVSQSFSGS
jgi:hypothetical protein